MRVNLLKVKGFKDILSKGYISRVRHDNNDASDSFVRNYIAYEKNGDEQMACMTRARLYIMDTHRWCFNFRYKVHARKVLSIIRQVHAWAYELLMKKVSLISNPHDMK